MARYEKETMAKNVRDTLLKLRGESDLSQYEFSKILGVQHSQVGKYEAGDSIPTSYTLYKMAKRLGVTMEQMLEGEFI